MELPAGTRVVDATGKHIYPGLIDAFSTVGIAEIGAVDVSNDVNELGDFNPNVRADVAVNAESRHIGTTRSAGVLTTLTTPGGGLVSGMSSALALEGWSWEEMSMQSAAALNVNWPNPNPRRFRGFGGRRFGQPSEPPPSYEEQVQQLKDFFAEARAYRDAVVAGEQVRSDSRYLAMVPVINGDIPVVVAADGAAQINDAITWAQEGGLRIVIRGGRDAIHVADRLVAEDIPVILTSTMAAPGRQYEAYDGTYAMPARLHEAGVRFAISGGSGSLYSNRAAVRGGRGRRLRAARRGGAEGGDDQPGGIPGARRPYRLPGTGQAGNLPDHDRNAARHDQRHRAGLHPGPRTRHDGHQKYFFEKYMEKVRQYMRAGDHVVAAGHAGRDTGDRAAARPRRRGEREHAEGPAGAGRNRVATGRF